MISIILGMALVTFFTRALFIMLPERHSLPKKMIEAMTFAPQVVLTAIVVSTVSDLAKNKGSLEYILLMFGSMLLAMSLSYKTKNLSLSVIAGLACFFGIQALI
ncbi:AzlD domain-containing protein [Aestuariibacter sp. AA17]|uniref:AzlD domain-containing protein n=1 Tax=Fluctibacter corallii TaxID=2984329 RepID=A0ABT3A6P7_9ALTE|nr:AzlD domain-containing protein [Aestuariibacter sp. AA17]MCV2884026.1 AzlD domain-containing protein [Aestuariibacter sp. AA17]